MYFYEITCQLIPLNKKMVLKETFNFLLKYTIFVVLPHCGKRTHRKNMHEKMLGIKELSSSQRNKYSLYHHKSYNKLFQLANQRFFYIIDFSVISATQSYIEYYKFTKHFFK